MTQEKLGIFALEGVTSSSTWSLEVFQVSVEPRFLSKRWLYMIWKSVGYAKSGLLLVSTDVNNISCHALHYSHFKHFFRQITFKGDSGPMCFAHKQDMNKAKAGKWILKCSIIVAGTKSNRNERTGWPRKVESSAVTIFWYVVCLK